MNNTTAEPPAKAAHTPTPWEGGAGDRFIYAKSHPQSPLAVVTGDDRHGRTKEEADANAEFIVRAVNAHDELMMALRALIDAYGMPWVLTRLSGFTSQNDIETAITKARVALAKATGGTEL